MKVTKPKQINSYSYNSYRIGEVDVVKDISYTINENGNVDAIWGKRIALYNFLTGGLFVLDELEWKVFDLVKNRKLESLNGNTKYVSILNNFQRTKIILTNNDSNLYLKEIKPKDTEIYIKLTEGCNFSCKGCATSSDLIPPNKAVTLDLETIKTYLEVFVRSSLEKNFKEINIKWAGGEPLLYRPYTLLKEGVKYAQKLQKKYKEAIINQTVLTNGVYLDEEKIKFLKENNIVISCSLWGTQRFQDLLRRPRNNSESYQTVVSNIRNLIKLKAEFNVNHVITWQNAEDFSEFITLMWDINSPNFVGAGLDYNKPIPLGLTLYKPLIPIPINVQRKQYKKIELGLRKGFHKILELINARIPIQPLYKFDYLNLFNVSTRTCGSGVNYVAVGPLGAANCHEGLYNMKPNIDKILNQKVNIFDLVNKDYVNKAATNYKNVSKAIFLHGGRGCPRMVGTQMVVHLYNNIYKELLALETIRQLKMEKNR